MEMESVIMDVIVSLTQMTVYAIYLKETLGFRRSGWWLPVWWAAVETAGWAGTVSGIPWNNALAYLLELEIVVFGMCRGHFLKKAFLALVYDVAVTAMEVICINAFILFNICDLERMTENYLLSASVLLMVQMFILFLSQLAIIVWKKHGDGEVAGRNWAGLFGMCGGCFAVVVILAMNAVSQDAFSLGQIIVLTILVALNFLSYSFYNLSAERTKAVAEAKVYEKQIEMYQDWYESIRASRQELHSFRHDMKNHMNVLRGLCRKEGSGKDRLEEIGKYVERISMDYLEIADTVDSGNPVLDVIISTKRVLAASRGIDMEVKLLVPEGMHCQGVDMVILLGNLLDNAIEACEKTGSEKREIGLEVRYQMANLLIILKNTYDGHLDGRTSETGVLIGTDKEDEKLHGTGMKNMLKVIEKYNGMMEWGAEEKVFRAKILLYGVGCE
ncbi:MAG: GHKL domain-containing protein [Lachnospiraceae bacterium]|nr:GHKL domain-containing protein [Lachnospiraceae bacterium]